MIVYGNAAVAQAGLQGYGGFGVKSGAKFELFNGVGFNEQWSYNDYFDPGYRDHVVYWGIPSYEIADARLLDRARKALEGLKSAEDYGNAQAGATLEQLVMEISNLCDSIDRQSKNRGTSGYGSAGDKQRSDYFNALNKSIKRLANTQVPAMPQPAAQPPVQAYAPAVQPAVTAPPQALMAQAGASTIGPLSTAPTSPAWIMPVAIVGGVLVFGGLIFMLTRKKKAPAMAGYRRRRIRR